MDRPMATPYRGRPGAGRVALLLVLGSETVFFGTLLVSYLFRRLSQAAGPFAEPGWAHLLLPTANTLVLTRPPRAAAPPPCRMT
jgi:heme/copper-type cytochrome/quinol oxidase subunit 3